MKRPGLVHAAMAAANTLPFRDKEARDTPLEYLAFIAVHHCLSLVSQFISVYFGLFVKKLF